MYLSCCDGVDLISMLFPKITKKVPSLNPSWGLCVGFVCSVSDCLYFFFFFLCVPLPFSHSPNRNSELTIDVGVHNFFFFFTCCISMWPCDRLSACSAVYSTSQLLTAGIGSISP